MEKKGKINVIAKTGGFKVESDDSWYNGIGEVKKQVLSDFAKGDFVKFVVEGKFVTDIEKVSVEQDGSSSFQSGNGFMVRMNVLNRAVEMFCHNKIDREDVLPVAREFEKWVLGDKE